MSMNTFCAGFDSGFSAGTAELDRMRAALRHEADCVAAAKAEIERLRGLLSDAYEWVPETPLLSDRITSGLKGRIREAIRMHSPEPQK